MCVCLHGNEILWILRNVLSSKCLKLKKQRWRSTNGHQIIPSLMEINTKTPYKSNSRIPRNPGSYLHLQIIFFTLTPYDIPLKFLYHEFLIFQFYVIRKAHYKHLQNFYVTSIWKPKLVCPFLLDPTTSKNNLYQKH